MCCKYKMIANAVSIHETVQIPFPPELRRSSRDPTREATYQEHENIKKYYKSRQANIKGVYRIHKNIKFLKYRAKIISLLMVEKYGESFGSLLTKKITEEYLTIPRVNKSDFYNVGFYNKCQSYIESGSVPMPISDPNPFRWHSTLLSYKEVMYLKSLKIIPDPRLIKYYATELDSYLLDGYDIMREGQEYILLSSST